MQNRSDDDHPIQVSKITRSCGKVGDALHFIGLYERFGLVIKYSACAGVARWLVIGLAEQLGIFLDNRISGLVAHFAGGEKVNCNARRR